MMNTLKNRMQNSIKKCSIKLVAKVFGGLLLVYLLLSYFAVNPIAQRIIPSFAEKSLASKASVGRVQFDPFRLKATVDDFQLAETNGKPLAGFKQLVVDLELSGMFDLAWKFNKIRVAEPQVHVAIAPNGQLNWDAFLNKLKEGEAESNDTIPRLIIQHIMVSKGKVQYDDADRPDPIKTTLTPLGFQLKGFSTLPKDRGDYFISAAFADNGGALKWKGDMGVNPVASKGVVALEGVEIANILELIEGLSLPFALNRGQVETSFSYDFTTPKKIPTLAVNNFTLNVRELAGELVADGSVFSLTHAGLSAPSLSFVNSQQPALQVNNLDFKLLDLTVSQPDQIELTLKESAASLPQLNFSMLEAPQLDFNDLNIKLADLLLNKGADYSLQVPTVEVTAVKLNLADGKANIQEVVLSNVAFGQAVSKEKVTKGVRLKEKPLASLKQIALSDSVILLADKKASAALLLLSGFETTVIKNADSTLNWADIFAPKNQSSTAVVIKDTSSAKVKVAEAASDQGDANAAWAVSVNKVALSEANVHIQDDSVTTPVVMDVEQASVEVEGASLDLSKPLPVKAAFNIKQGGRFTTKGQLWLAPFKAKLGLRLSALSLKPFAPYVNQIALLKLSDGTASVSGQLDLKQQKKLAVTFNGRFGVKKFALLEEADDAPFLSWDDLSSKRLRLSLIPNKLHMATLNVTKPSGKFIINEDKSMNVARVLRSQSAEPLNKAAIEDPEEQQKAVAAQVNASLIQAAEQQTKETLVKDVVAVEAVSMRAPAKEAFPVRIDAVRLNDAALEFADLSLTPQFGTNIHSLNGVINGLSTKAAEVAQVEMDGKVDSYGAARIRGSLQPFSATDFTDIKLAFTNLDMSRMTPYSGKFAGRRIDSGKLSVDLEYKVKQHQLAGENKFVINQLKLGEKVESADAADLPLDLAIAILEDSDGVIDLDLPISGSLDDPTFSYGSIFWKAIRNVLTKIVTAPFRALGSIFGSGAEDFDGIAFEAGDSEISPPELEKLVKVSTALTKRKGLSLGIVPSYHIAVDGQAIKESTYRMQVAEEMGLELAEGQKPGPIDLGNESAREAIDVLYNKLTKKGFLKRMASKFETPEEGHYEKAQESLIASIEVTDAALQSLAKARAKAIFDALLSQKVSEDRLKMTDAIEIKDAKASVKVALTLDANQSATKRMSSTLEETLPKEVGELNEAGETVEALTPLGP